MGENVADEDILFEWSFALKIFILNIITQKWEGARSYLPPKLDYILRSKSFQVHVDNIYCLPQSQVLYHKQLN